MASGKSTVGQQLAESLTWPFVDLDAVIEDLASQRWGTDISGLFEMGEHVFRNVEADCLRQVLSHIPSPFVLSLGGGTLHNGVLAQTIMAQTTLFVLVASWETVQERIQGSGRPLKDVARVLYEQRLSGYAVGIPIDVDNRSLSDIVDDIRQKIIELGLAC